MLTKNLIDTRSFLIDLTCDNMLNGDADNALKCVRLLNTVDSMIEGDRQVTDEEREAVASLWPCSTKNSVQLETISI